MQRAISFRAALLEVAAEAERKAAELERCAMQRAGSGQAREAPRVADLLIAAQVERRHATGCRIMAEGIRF